MSWKVSLEEQLNDQESLSIELLILRAKTYWYLIKPIWWLPFLVAILVTVSTYVALLFLKDDRYKSGAILIRHEKNMSSQSDIPYLYLQMDFNTVLQTILLQENLQKVIDRLDLDMDPRDLYKRIEVKRGDRSEIIHIASTAETPMASSILTNTITDIFLENYASVQNSAAQKVNSYLSEQINLEKDKLSALQDQVFNQRQLSDTIDLDIQLDKEYVKIKGIELRIIEENIARDSLNRKITSYKEKLKATPQKISLEDALSSSNDKLINELQSSLDTLQLKYTEKNPKIIKLKARINDLEKQSQQKKQLPKYKSNKMGPNPFYTQLELSLLTTELSLIDNSSAIDNYHSQLQLLNQEVQRLNSLKRQYLVDQRRIDDARSLIIDLERRAQEARFAIDSNISDFDVIQRALIPLYPEKSFRKIIAIALGFLSFIATCLVIILKIFLKKEIYDLVNLNDINPKTSTFFFPTDSNSANLGINYLESNQQQLKLLSQIDSWTREREKISISVQSFNQSIRKQIHLLLSELYHHKQVQVMFVLSNDQEGLALDVISGCAKDHTKQRYISDFLKEVKEGDTVNLLTQSETLYISREDLDYFQTMLFNTVDIIIWDISSAESHNQLYTLINSLSLVVLITGRWSETNKKLYHSIIQEAIELPTEHIALVIDQVPSYLTA